MPLESASYISQLVPSNPPGTDPKSQGDDHLRLIKTVLQTQFPNFGTAAAMNASIAELNYVVGVTSGIQGQINAKAPLANPALTGTPTAPTATAGTNSTQIATTAYSDGAVGTEAATRSAADTTLNNTKANKAGDTYSGAQNFTGATITVPTQAGNDNSTNAASTAMVQSAVLGAAVNIPGQAGNAGKVLTTDGTTATWNFANILRYLARTSNTIFAQADNVRLVDYTSGTFNQDYTSFVTLGAGWSIWTRNAGSGVVTLDPNGTQTIGGALTAALNPGDVQVTLGDGANGQLLRLAGMNRIVINSGSGNFTVPPGCYRLKYRLWGAGGGANASAGNAFAGAGGYAEGWMTVTPNSTIAYAIGAAGTTSGTAGGATTFGSVSAGGGTGINGSGNAASGNGSGGDFNMTGGLGFLATSLLIGATAPMGGPTGGFPGGGAAAASTTTAAGQGGLLIVEWV